MRQTKTQTRDDEEAVSPVIGVILMVAITVILAAVIGTFVLGLGDEVEETVTAGVNFDVDAIENEVSVSVVTMGNADYVMLVGDHTLNESANPYVESTGETITLTTDELETPDGSLTAVGVIGGATWEGTDDDGGDTFDMREPEDGAVETGLQTETWEGFEP